MSFGKRAAGRELNHDNWNDEDEGEEVGEFKKATEIEIRNRLIKTAKRRIAGDSENSPSSSPFGSFSGFNTNTTNTSSTSASTFGFLAKHSSMATLAPKTNGSLSSSSSSSDEKSGAQIEYLSKLKALNVAALDWMKTHIDENPLCILTPIFTDYEKYLKELESAKNKQKSEEKSVNDSKTKSPEPTPAPSAGFSFGKPSAPPASSTPATTSSSSVFSSFKFGGDMPKPAASPPKQTEPVKGISFGSGLTENKGISFGSTSSDNKITFGSSAQPGAAPTFSFGSNSTPLFGALSSSSTPSFSFANTVPPANTEALKAGDDADEEPPKNDFVPVVEDDSLYSKRCKVFVKSGADYNDRGVGTLFIKKVEEDKIQMIVRADTNLGNIIFNIMIVEGLPVSRLSKNNVMVVCIPTPDAKPPPTSVLLRVKTAEEADELLETIKKHMK